MLAFTLVDTAPPTPEQLGYVMSRAHDWRSNPFWHMDAQNPLATATLQCARCGAVKIIGKPMPMRCHPHPEALNSGFTHEP